MDSNPNDFNSIVWSELSKIRKKLHDISTEVAKEDMISLVLKEDINDLTIKVDSLNKLVTSNTNRVDKIVTTIGTFSKALWIVYTAAIGVAIAFIANYTF